ncbi:hypothetical protein BMS3Bbin02_00197 [bacterium BMS3Bbin02]|nr:hypothetical protein BMS3Bbin02_00197 [bacterium BMS3Bbin02]
MFVFESVGVAFEGEDVGVVDEPVDHGFDGDEHEKAAAVPYVPCVGRELDGIAR